MASIIALIAQLAWALSKPAVWWMYRTLTYIASLSADDFFVVFRLAYTVWVLEFAILAYFSRWILFRRRMFSLVMAWFRRDLNVSFRKLVQRDFKLRPAVFRNGQNPHARQAADRTNVTEEMKAFARRVGMRPYIVSPSDRENDEAGWRDYYSIPDLRQKTRRDKIGAKDLLLFTDVDYYADMHYFLSLGRPCMMYSWVPFEVSSSGSPYAYTFVDDEVQYHCSGSSDYRHQLWDYNTDYLVSVDASDGIQGFLWNVFGITFGVTVSSVDQWATSLPDRRLISVTPRVRLPIWCSVWERYLMGGKWLQRLRVSFSGYSMLRHHTEKGLVVSIAKQGEFCSVELPEAVLCALHRQFRFAKTPQLSDVQRWCKQHDVENREGMTILYEYLRDEWKMPNVSHVHKPGEFALHYSYVKPDTVDTDKFYGRRFAPAPLGDVEDAFPTESRGNENRSVDKRVTSQLNTTRPPRIYDRYAQEFLQLLVPQPGKGTPVSSAVIADNQTRPLQKQRLIKSALDLFSKNFVVRAMLKRESYEPGKDPRNISTVPMDHTLRLSEYTYAFKDDILKPWAWYSPGQSPAEISSVLMHFCSENDRVVLGDYSRFDGTISQWMRTHVEQAMYLRWVAPQHADELQGLLRREVDAKAFTALGTAYEPKASRLSGSPLTTDANTAINAFVQFAALRLAGRSPDEAMNRLGLLCGDDSVAAQETAKKLPIAARNLGLELKLEIAEKHQAVSYLSRVFVDPWTENGSFQEPIRTLRKLHLVRPSFTNSLAGDDQCKLAGANKVAGYLVTDSHTPGIGNWCRCYQRITGLQGDVDADDPNVSYYARDNQSWPQSNTADLVALVAARMDIDPTVLKTWCNDLDKFRGEVKDMPQLSLPAGFTPTDQDYVVSDPGDGSSIVRSFVEAKKTQQENQTKEDGTKTGNLSRPDKGSGVRAAEGAKGSARTGAGSACPRRQGAPKARLETETGGGSKFVAEHVGGRERNPRKTAKPDTGDRSSAVPRVDDRRPFRTRKRKRRPRSNLGSSERADRLQPVSS